MTGTRSITPFRVTLALVLVMVAVLLAAGCAGQQAGVTPSNSVQTGTQTGTGTYWIKIDPISNKNIGDKFSITAITNLPAGNEVRCEISSMNIPLKNTSYESAIVPVISGVNGLNKTVIDIDSSEIIPNQYSNGEFIIIERAIRENAKDVAPFRLDRVLYTIDFSAIGDKMFGDKFTITGITNLPAGEEVIVNIQSSSNESSAIRGAATIVKGNEGLNTTSFTVDTSNFLPVEYDKYRVTGRFAQENFSAFGETIFRISNRSLSPYFITIDPTVMVTFGYDGGFRSTTNLPVGDEVFWEIRSQPAPSALILNGTVKVTKGKADLNGTSFTVDASVFTRSGSYRYLLTERAKKNEVQDYHQFGVVPVP
jgi:hypothetical protein